MTQKNKAQKQYTISKTSKETLGKWYYLMALGRKLDEKWEIYTYQFLTLLTQQAKHWKQRYNDNFSNLL